MFVEVFPWRSSEEENAMHFAFAFMPSWSSAFPESSPRDSATEELHDVPKPVTCVRDTDVVVQLAELVWLQM